MEEMDWEAFAKSRFSRGDKVCFDDKDGVFVGFISKINRKTISIRSVSSDDDCKRVPPAKLRLLERACNY